MTIKNYRIRISRAGQEFEVEGDKAFVLKMLERFEAPVLLEGVTPNASSKKSSREKGAEKPLSAKVKAVSIREFIQQLGFKKHTDITLAFGYYLERQAQTTEFTAADINNCYYEAKIESSNTSQMIINNIKRGYMMPSKAKGEKGRKRYTLTISGEKYIEEKAGST